MCMSKTLDSTWTDRFAGVDRLYGKGALAFFAQSRVVIIGIGGVGSWAAEALARTGIGHITLIDADDVCVSNTNRQLPAHEPNYGRSKAHLMADRLRAINPAIDVSVVESFLTPSNMAELLDNNYDVVLDACDSFRVKVEMTAWCRRRKLPLVIVGAAGGRTDPTLIRTRDLSKTEHDAMLALIRRKLREEFNFPKSKDRYFGVYAVYSLQNVQYPQADGTVCGIRPNVSGDAALNIDCGGGLGSVTHVTGAFAFAACAKVIALLLKIRAKREAQTA